MRTQRTSTSTHWPPSTRQRCRTSYQYSSYWIAIGYSKNKHFQCKAMLRKMEVSFEQWYHVVKWFKNHYPESMVWESIVRLLKGAAADMAQYMGPITSMPCILQKLTIIFGIVALFDVLMWNFYKVTQGNHEKVPPFTTRLEGTLNQIRLQCPRIVTYLEVQQHLKDCLFHGVHKHIRNSIRCLYSNPRTTYSQLMVVAHKMESENEKAHIKVRARSAVTTDPVEGTMELGHQIDKLIATLTRAGQGKSPASAPNSPRQRGHGRGWMDRSTLGCPSSHNGQTDLGQTASVCSTSSGCGTGTTTNRDQGQNTQGSKDRQEGTANRRNPSSL